MDELGLSMSPEVANADHCTKGGSIISGKAVCNCGTWRASDYAKEARKISRDQHLSLVLQVRTEEWTRL